MASRRSARAVAHDRHDPGGGPAVDERRAGQPRSGGDGGPQHSLRPRKRVAGGVVRSTTDNDHRPTSVN